MIDISFIIPAYKCAGLIGDTVASIYAQKCHCTFEVIIVEDGSKDGTFEVCSELADRYENLVVLQQENAGPSAARNLGLKHAQGEFIVFVDADDLLEQDMLSILHGLGKGDADLGIASYFIDFLDGEKKSTEQVIIKDGTYSVHSDDFSKVCCEWYSHHILTPLWNKIYRKSIIEQYNLRFDESVSISEDLLWNIDYIKHIERITTTEKCVYHYINRKKRETVTHGFNEFHVQMQIKIAVEMMAFLQQVGKCENIIYYLSLKYITSSLCNIFYDKGKHNKKEFIREVLNDSVVKELAEKAVPEGIVAKAIVMAYKNKNVGMLKCILRALYIARRYFHAIQRSLMKLIRN